MMNEIVKERLALIQSGTVPPGYKKTKFGIYPENWELTCMGNCIREYREISNNIQDIPVYSSSRIGLLPQSEYYDGKEATQTNIGYKVVPPNYLTYRHMSDDDIFHFNMNQTGGNILVSSEYPVFTVSDIAELGFILPVLNNAPRFKYFCGMQKLGGTRTRLYFKKLCAYQFYIPPLAEQKKIAEILEQCDRIIALKKLRLEAEVDRKKWVVNQLLHHFEDYRVPGYDGDWKVSTIGSVTTSFSGGTPTSSNSSYYADAGIPFIRSGEIGSKTTELYLSDQGFYNSAAKMVEKGDLLYALYGANSGECFVSKMNGAINQAILCIRSDEIDICFLNYVLSSMKDWIVATFLQGGQGNLSGGIIKKLKISYPEKDEQRAIVEIIQSQDTVIEKLEDELQEFKERKKALMQLLLTGIVRVKP